MSDHESKAERVCRPESFPRERIVIGELHLIRARIDSLLGELSGIAADDCGEEWLRVEEAARIARSSR